MTLAVTDPYDLGLWPPMQIPGTFTFLTLPAIPNLPLGTQCYTTDAGLCVWNGGAWGSSGGAGAYTPAGSTAAAINAAYTTANANGGGTVYLAGKRYNLEITVVPKSGVKLKGVRPQLVYNTIPDSGLTTLTGSAGGTVLAPTGAFDAIAWNTASLAAPASQTAFSQAALSNIAFEDLGFSGDAGGVWGIHAGGTNNPACWNSDFVNLYATGFTTTGGGFNVTNYQHCKFITNYAFGCAWGQLHQIDVASASLAPGNSTYYDLYCCNPVGSGVNAVLARNVTFLTTATTGGAANNNEFKFDRMQSNRFGGAAISQAATMVNTQANITITDGTKFAVGLPVSVDATQNGFTLKKVYWVVSLVGNVIQLANTYGGAAIAATAANAVNIVHTGFPCFEMISLAGSANTNIVMDNVDVEGLATVGMFFQNCNGINLQVSQVPGTAQATQSICFRGCVNKAVIAPQSVSTDDDQNAVGAASAFIGAKFGTSVGYQGMGLWYDSVSNKSVLSLGNPFDTQAAGTFTYDPSTGGGLLMPKNMGLGQLTKSLNGTITISQLNTVYNNSGAAAVMTLPSVVAANVGAWLEITNNSGGAQTVNTDGVQLFNGIAARTSLTLNDKATVRLSATAGVTTWCVVPGSAMAAGVVAAGS